jgi:REP element-mobilizing transposase RayT
MPTPLRIASPGAVYHVRSRGNDRGGVFFDDADRRYYLDLLYSAVTGFRLKVYAYALMSNHIHLFLRTLLPNISEAMYRVNIDYAHYFNRRHRRTGHLFESRFKSKLVQEDRYFLALLRYVHMNPVSAGLVAGPGEYDWSSHKAYLGRPDRVVSDTREGLLLFSDDVARARAAYLEFLGKPVPEKELKALDSERNGILGDPTFRKSLKKAAGAF